MSISAEIIAVGTELLLGQILNSNAQFLSREFAGLGIDVYRQSTVGDNRGRIAAEVKAAMARADLLVLCGGLGPTEDDCTREGVAEALELPLVLDPVARAQLEEQFAGRPMTANNLRQATAPSGSVILPNPRGTAPGIFIDHGGKLIFLLPGPPRELTHMFTNEVVPILRSRGVIEGSIFSRTLHMAGIGESTLAATIADLIDAQTDPTIALYSRLGEVDVRLTTKAAESQYAKSRIDSLEREIMSRVGEHVFAYDDMTLAGALGTLLREKGHTLSVAESCTGGLIGHMITGEPGSSSYFLGGLTCYSNDAKRELLSVSDRTLKEFGAVSEECAAEMLAGVVCCFGSSVGIAVTGVAGPDGGTERKPVGTVCLAYGSASSHRTVTVHLRGERAAVKERAAKEAMRRLLLWLKEDEPR
jgi:nicotinamide-nucleotide amidase